MSIVDVWRQQRTRHWLSKAWAEGFYKVLILFNPDDGAALAIEAREPRAKDWNDWKNPLWIFFPCDNADSAGLYVGCSGSVIQRLGRMALADPVDEGMLAAETYREIVSQTATIVASSILAKSNNSIVFSGGVDITEPSDPTLGVEFWFQLDGEPGNIVVVPSIAFLSTIEEASSDKPEQGDTRAEQEEEVLSVVARRNLEMLLDLEMEVAVSFGQTQMLLEDVLKLSIGSIVELNCQASDPVEVLVNDTIIARGEVVVVDSNYGVRITDVSSRKERIQSIL